MAAIGDCPESLERCGARLRLCGPERQEQPAEVQRGCIFYRQKGCGTYQLRARSRAVVSADGGEVPFCLRHHFQLAESQYRLSLSLSGGGFLGYRSEEHTSELQSLA